jgi:putative colanic acid biosynthesis acetyltransferase WcaF
MKFTIHTSSLDYSGASPWTISERFFQICWGFCWTLFCKWTPKPLNSWRLFWLKLFGAIIHGKPFVHQRARIQIPWNLTLHDAACVGDRANLYTLGPIEICRGATIAQEAYLSTGTHDFSHPSRPLLTAKITIGNMAFLGARVFVMPGVSIGEHSIVGACSVVTKNIPPFSRFAGNPAKCLSKSE